MQIMHFFVHGIEVFWSAVHFAVYAHFFEFFLYLLANGIQKSLSFGFFPRHVFGNVFVLLRKQILHRKVLEFALEERNTKPARKRSVDIERLFCDTLLFLFGQILK